MSIDCRDGLRVIMGIVTTLLFILLTAWSVDQYLRVYGRDKDLLYSNHEYSILQASDSTLLVIPKDRNSRPYIINIKE